MAPVIDRTCLEQDRHFYDPTHARLPLWHNAVRTVLQAHNAEDRPLLHGEKTLSEFIVDFLPVQSIVIRRLNGREAHIPCEPSFTVSRLKEEINKSEDIQVESMRLVARGRHLNDDNRLVTDYKLSTDTNIWIVLPADVPGKVLPSPRRTMASRDNLRIERDLRRRYPTNDSHNDHDERNKRMRSATPTAFRNTQLSFPQLY